jgi:hypothetical protein
MLVDQKATYAPGETNAMFYFRLSHFCGGRSSHRAHDAVYVLFTNAVVRRHRLPAATWACLVLALSDCGHLLYQSLGLCAVRSDGFLHRRVRYHDLSAFRPNLSAPAGRLCASLNSVEAT